MNEYINNLVLGFSAPFILWSGAIACAWARVLYRNRDSYRNVLNLPRNTRIQLAAWLYMFDVMTSIIWQRGTSFVSIWSGAWAGSAFFQHAIMGYLFYIVPGLALGVWWSSDRAYGEEAGDRYFWRLIWWGLALGAVVFAVSIWMGK